MLKQGNIKYKNDKWLETFYSWVDDRDQDAAFQLLGELRTIAANYAKYRFVNGKEAKTWEDIAGDAFLKLTKKYKNHSRESFAQGSASNFHGLMKVTIKNAFLNLRSFQKNKTIFTHTEPIEELAEKETTDELCYEAKPDEKISNVEFRKTLKNCLQNLRVYNEFRWITIRLWLELHCKMDLEDEIQTGINHLKSENKATETSRIITSLKLFVNNSNGKAKLKKETREKTNGNINENSVKSDIRRAKDFLRKCLETKESVL